VLILKKTTTRDVLPDKDFNPMAGSEDFQGNENLISSNKRSASCDQNVLQGG